MVRFLLKDFWNPWNLNVLNENFGGKNVFVLSLHTFFKSKCYLILREDQRFGVSNVRGQFVFLGG